MANESIWAGRGRTHGRSNIWTQDGRLVATTPRTTLSAASKTARTTPTVIHLLAGATTRRVSALGKLAVYGDIAARRAPGEPGRALWDDLTKWPPLWQTDLHPTVDVEDVSMALFELDNGVMASYQQCHFSPDYWRNYTVIGTEGRLENFGDTGPGSAVKMWNRRSGYRCDADAVWPVPVSSDDGHGGADTRIVAEFVRFAREGGATLTSPVAARDSVAAAFMATLSLRADGQPFEVPPVDASLAAYFEGGQV